MSLRDGIIPTHLPVRLTIPLSLAVMFVALAYLHAYLELHSCRESIQRQALVRADAFAKQEAPMLEAEVSAQHWSTVQHLMDLQTAMPDYSFTVLVDQEGHTLLCSLPGQAQLGSERQEAMTQLIASSFKESNFKPSLSADGNFVRVATPLTLHGQTAQLSAARVPVLYSETDLRPLYAEQRSEVIAHVFTLAMWSLLVCLVVWSYMERTFSRHLNTLAANLHRYRNGSVPLIVPAGGASEVAEVGEALGQLVDTLESEQLLLKKTAAKLSGIIDNLPDAYLRVDAQGRVLIANPAAASIFGYPSGQEIVGMPVVALYFDPADREAMLRDLMDCGAVHDRSHRCRRKDGSVFWTSAEVRLMRNEAGEFAGTEAVVRDITERRRSELALLDSEARFRAVVENSHEGILFADAKGRILYRSPGFAHITGFADKERLGADGFQAVHPDDLPVVRRQWARLISQPGSTIGGEIRILHKTGAWRYVEGTAQNLLCHPNVHAVVLTARDVTGRRNTEEELRSSRELFASSFLHNPAACMISEFEPGTIEADGMRVLDTNEAFEKITGYSRDEILGKYLPGLKLWVDEETRKRSVEVLVREGCFEDRELKMRTKSGEIRTGFCSIQVFQFRTQSIALWSFTDCTEHIRADAEITHLREEFHQAQKLEAVARLTGGVAHDFNNMLMVILAQADLMKMACDDPKLGERADSIKHTARRAADLTRQLLAFSRKQVLMPSVQDVNEILKSMSNMLDRVIEENIRVEFQLSPAVPRLLVDRSQIEQVIMNLVVNARDAMPTGGTLVIRTTKEEFDADTVRVHPIPTGDYVHIAVIDDGVGMSPEVRERVFEPFFTTKPEGKGTGLGLASVFGIVKQSGGFIFLESELGKGTTFNIYLPAIPSGSTVRALKKPLKSARSLSPISILVVEDQDEMRNAVCEILKSCGHYVRSAYSVQSGLKLVLEDKLAFDLILTDVLLQDGSARELVEKLLQAGYGGRVIFMSGYTSEVIASHGVQESEIFFLQKPFSRKTLLSKIEEALAAPVGVNLPPATSSPSDRNYWMAEI